MVVEDEDEVWLVGDSLAELSIASVMFREEWLIMQ